MLLTEAKPKLPGPNNVSHLETRWWNWITIQASSFLLFLTCNHQNSAYRREADKRNDGNSICCKKIRPLRQSCSILVQWSKKAQTRRTSSKGTTRLTLPKAKPINSALSFPQNLLQLQIRLTCTPTQIHITLYVFVMESSWTQIQRLCKSERASKEEKICSILPGEMLFLTDSMLVYTDVANRLLTILPLLRWANSLHSKPVITPRYFLSLRLLQKSTLNLFAHPYTHMFLLHLADQ